MLKAKRLFLTCRHKCAARHAISRFTAAEKTEETNCPIRHQLSLEHLTCVHDKVINVINSISFLAISKTWKINFIGLLNLKWK
jgi:hypothetical protein